MSYKYYYFPSLSRAFCFLLWWSLTVCIVKAMFFSSSHVWMWELDHEEGWTLKNWCFQTVVLKKTLESPLDSKEIKCINPRGNQPWIFIGGTDAEAEAPMLWPSHAKNWLTGKRPWCWERLKARGEGDYRGWDGWMASLTRWTWVWASSKSWSMTGKPGMLHSMWLQRVRCDLATGQQQLVKASGV